MKLPNIDKKKTGDNLKRIMDSRKIDVYTLSQKLGLRSTTSVYYWQQGRFLPNLDSLIKIAYILSCDVNDIIATEDGKNA